MTGTGSAERSVVYEALVGQLRRYWRELQEDEQHGVISFPPSKVDDIARVLFSNLTRGGVATFVVSGRRGWDPQSYYFEAARLAARNGRTITRAFLLPHRQYLNEDVLQLHWRLDLEAGIEVKILYVGDMLPGLLSAPSTLDFGIWDDSVVCSAIWQESGGAKGVSQWRISSRPEDIELARSLWDELLQRSDQLPPPGTDQSLPDLEEPMVKTAPLMDLLASAVCSGAYVSREDCSWYHGVWQYLRIFDMVSTPTWHSAFYLDELKRVAEQGREPAFLISGTADYSVLAHVLWALDEAGTTGRIIVLDLCETPLILCRWYARKQHREITTVQADILRPGLRERFDCIVTDAFLTRFDLEARRRVLDAWVSLLRPGGRVVSTVRVGGAGVDGPVLAKPEQVDVFRKRALGQATRWRDFLPLSPEEVAARAQRYAERMTSFPAPSAEQLRRELAQRGLAVERFDLVDVKGEMAPTTYVELTARRVS
jgi:SAM-dependent methyltransferase